MVMLCWFYCVPFMKMLYYASAGVLVLFAAFVFRRGICRARNGLRLAACLMMFVAAVKVWVFDLRDLDRFLVCDRNWRVLDMLCTPAGLTVMALAGLAGLCATAWGLLYLYHHAAHGPRPRLVAPEQLRMRRWANITMMAVIFLMCWTLAPWVGTLTVGEVPDLLVGAAWQYISLACLGLLLTGFWRAEACDWQGTRGGAVVERQRAMGIKPGSQASAGWTARDTLWMAAFLFLITIGLSYVSYDVLGD